MNIDPELEYRRLLRMTLAAVLTCAVLVAGGYFFVDRPVAFFVHDRHVEKEIILKELTYPPPLMQAWTPVVLVVLLVRHAWGPWRRWQATVVAACLAMIVADQFRETLGFMAGRYWPETWIDNNPSLIKDGAYGFHPFHGGSAYGSFPSGHTARTIAVAAVFWIAYPRWRWFGVLCTIAVACGLVGMNYHFVSDVIAGGFVGGVVGAYAAYFAKVGPADPHFGNCQRTAPM